MKKLLALALVLASILGTAAAQTPNCDQHAGTGQCPAEPTTAAPSYTG